MDEEQDEVKSLSHSKDFGGVSSAVSLSVKEVPVKPTKVEMLPVPGKILHILYFNLLSRAPYRFNLL